MRLLVANCTVLISNHSTATLAVQCLTPFFGLFRQSLSNSLPLQVVFSESLQSRRRGTARRHLHLRDKYGNSKRLLNCEIDASNVFNCSSHHVDMLRDVRIQRRVINRDEVGHHGDIRRRRFRSVAGVHFAQHLDWRVSHGLDDAKRRVG